MNPALVPRQCKLMLFLEKVSWNLWLYISLYMRVTFQMLCGYTAYQRYPAVFLDNHVADVTIEIWINNSPHKNLSLNSSASRSVSNRDGELRRRCHEIYTLDFSWISSAAAVLHNSQISIFYLFFWQNRSQFLATLGVNDTVSMTRISLGLICSLRVVTNEPVKLAHKTVNLQGTVISQSFTKRSAGGTNRIFFSETLYNRM